MQNIHVNTTKFGQQFYDNLEPVGVDIQEIPDLDRKNSEELDILGQELCREVAVLAPDSAGEFLNGCTTNRRKYNGLICRFIESRDIENGRIAGTDIPYDHNAHHYSQHYILLHNEKISIIKKLHKIKEFLRCAQEKPELFADLQTALHIAKEFECIPGVNEKLSAAINAMSSKVQQSIIGLFYFFKDNKINDIAPQFVHQGNVGQSTHYIAGLRSIIKDSYNITQVDAGWMPNNFDFSIRLALEFSKEETLKECIDYISNILNEEIGTYVVNDETFMASKAKANTLFAHEDFPLQDLYNIDELYTKKQNFEAIIRQQTIRCATLKNQFFVDPMMKILSMNSVKDLMIVAEGYDQSYQAVLIKKDFMNMQDILDSLKTVTCMEHKNELIAALDTVKSELDSLDDIPQQMQRNVIISINDCIIALNALAPEHYQENSTQAERAEEVRLALSKLNPQGILTAYNNDNISTFRLLVNNQDDFNKHDISLWSALDTLKNSLGKNELGVKDLDVTTMEHIKAFCLFVIKTILTVGILPLYELISGKEVVQSTAFQKREARKEIDSFQEFIASNAAQNLRAR